ncbi:hypothetical protein [Methylophaga nitratireducenticrescens]|uniref:hypothetical protein n=1 Tax=Methylophaga nitratireducenticrescens TaxID=754476 RepID=UPI000CDCAD5A|nr:hypothetical protein [Methylophaga nitratireducenticrescens]AUZ84775.1 hypothetical protein CDW43_09390 [Methylophaga nitratireducenticrescens]
MIPVKAKYTEIVLFNKAAPLGLYKVASLYFQRIFSNVQKLIQQHYEKEDLFSGIAASAFGPSA